MRKLLQFTDLHLRDDPAAQVRGVVPQRSFEQALYHARQNHWPPDAVLLTGDLANDEFERTYVRIATMAASWRVPVLAVAGNHDDSAALRAAFDGIPNAADEILDLDGWRVIGLNSRVPGEVHGELAETQWRLLEDGAATRGERELLVAVHHPPVEVGSPWLDRSMLRDAERFRARLAALGVRACVFGHVHQCWDSVEAGVRYLGTPATSRQFARQAQTYAEDDAPPAYRWLELAGDGGLDTDVVQVREH